MKYIPVILPGVLLVVCLTFEENLKLSILHVTDSHEFVEGDDDTAKCIENETGYFVSGMPTMIDTIKRWKIDDKKTFLDTIVLNTGSFTGSKWSDKFYDPHNKLDTKIINDLNDLGIDYSSFGHHGFTYSNGDELRQTEWFLRKLEFPVLAATLGAIRLRNVAKSEGMDVGVDKSYEIGIVGYYTPHNETEKKTFAIDECEAISVEARRLRRNGVKTVIALGHSGRLKDRVLAYGCNEIDLFIGAHATETDNNSIFRNYPHYKWDPGANERVFFNLRIFNVSLNVAGIIVTVDTETGNILEVVPRPLDDEPESVTTKAYVSTTKEAVILPKTKNINTATTNEEIVEKIERETDKVPLDNKTKIRSMLDIHLERQGDDDLDQTNQDGGDNDLIVDYAHLTEMGPYGEGEDMKMGQTITTLSESVLLLFLIVFKLS